MINRLPSGAPGADTRNWEQNRRRSPNLVPVQSMLGPCRIGSARRPIMIGPAIRRVIALVVACLLLPIALHAQTVGASLQGIVTDATGAGLPNADVVVIATATGGVRELKTDATGHYS